MSSKDKEKFFESRWGIANLYRENRDSSDRKIPSLWWAERHQADGAL